MIVNVIDDFPGLQITIQGDLKHQAVLPDVAVAACPRMERDKHKNVTMLIYGTSLLPLLMMPARCSRTCARALQSESTNRTFYTTLRDFETLRDLWMRQPEFQKRR